MNWWLAGVSVTLTGVTIGLAARTAARSPATDAGGAYIRIVQQRSRYRVCLHDGLAVYDLGAFRRRGQATRYGRVALAIYLTPRNTP